MPGKKILRTDGWKGVNYTIDPAHLPDDVLSSGFNYLLRSKEAVPIGGSARLSGSSLNGDSFFGAIGLSRRVDYIKQFFDTARGKTVVLAHERTTGKLKIIEDYIGATESDYPLVLSKLLIGHAANNAAFNHAAGSNVVVADDFEGENEYIGEATRWAGAVETYYAVRKYIAFDTSALAGKTVIRARLRFDINTYMNETPIVSPPWNDQDELEFYYKNFGTLDPTDWAAGTLLGSVPVGNGDDDASPWDSRPLQAYHVRSGDYEWWDFELSRSMINLTGQTQFQFMLKKERLGAGVLPEDGNDYARWVYEPSCSLIVETA